MKQNIPGLKLPLILFAICSLLLACETKKINVQTTVVHDTTWAIVPFLKADALNPILLPGQSTFLCPILKKQVRWDEKDVFNPAAVIRDGKVYMIFRAEDTIGKFAGTSRLGLAISEDGLNFSKMKEPVFYPDNDSLRIYEWEGGVEDPRIVASEDGQYVMTYTAYDGQLARLLIATSTDLVHWIKHGTVLNGKYKNTWSKSGAIVAQLSDSTVKATKINGKYWMYFGDTDLFMANSDDLIHWQPVEQDGKLRSVLKPRPGYFDSRLVESGPFALVTGKGIQLIYNGMNLDTGGDTTLAPGAYCAGQALFDKNDPTTLIDRLEKNFLRPDKPYEISGQINQVCFVEGMVPFHGKWFLYYGTADSRIAAAVKEAQ
ncbi:MAG TPA: glycoside hydrolase family 130 protein [Chryseolinea sp.]|nr:glycoside hydrolase family 130 protein [Chryseolinea sp.]